ncbi:MAG: DEAD/DEAH box helicase family protein [Candidatus Lambdaproteobacteria bacterium]|nr:DEAD/DEAH box helicase family protein [Candidatus Lambdaproteobacteria bacterium]
MSPSPIINPEALEPLYAPWEEPNVHRVRVEQPEGAPPRVIKGRRPTSIVIAQNLRPFVREWRESGYPGASDTTRTLLNHWFNRSHNGETPAGEPFEFRYYFCQREAVETFIYLKEVREIPALSRMIEEFGGPEGPDKEAAVNGVSPEEDEWSRYAFKLATGAGKTKVISLAIVWSYFHALRESDSPMARHFVVIAPNLTVFERLREDFAPPEGGPTVIEKDPLVPPEWKGDWNLSVVVQDEAGGAVTGGALYLTNIHRLYDPKKRRGGEPDTYPWVGPAVSRAKALDTGAELRDRITAHPRLMVLNDEAHHVWDPDSAWNEAIHHLHDTVRKRNGTGLAAQLDFSATPKDNSSRPFKHIVCDAPLGEAVDCGIVKVPIIGKAGALEDHPHESAAYRYEKHLLVGYERWKASWAEWQGSGKKPLMFVMCEDTDAANEIAQRLNTDALFKDLNGTTINLHTNLKGRVKQVGRGADKRPVFEESEKEISDEDLKALRKLSRELDSNASPYRCIVSVMMLREGWDVRNVTTIVPLRPYSSKANILPEQTLGRGLRRMYPPGQAPEIVTVVEHPAFESLYREQLAQEGLPIQSTDADKVPGTTVSIFPDPKKDWKALDIRLPQLTGGHQRLPKLEGLTFDDVQQAFRRHQPLPLGGKGTETLEYEGRQLFTGEVVERMVIHLPLLQSGVGAVSYYVKELETICKVRNTWQTLGPLVTRFLEELLFAEKTSLYDERLVSRLASADVREHIRAVFVSLIRKRTTTTEIRAKEAQPISLATWKPFQATHSEKHPAVPSPSTLFNLVPCNRALEQSFADFVTKARDVAAFAKNAGPQCLGIDYLAAGHRLAFYTPDFFVRTATGRHYLVETKGRVDLDVPTKARAAVEWCKAASARTVPWYYLFIPHDVFGHVTGNTFDELARACAPSLAQLVEESPAQPSLPGITDEGGPALGDFITPEQLASLPKRYATAIDHAIQLYRFQENKPLNFAPVFNPMLGVMDHAATEMIVARLNPHLPVARTAQDDWFAPYLGRVPAPLAGKSDKLAKDLKRAFVYRNPLSPIGLLNRCFDFARSTRENMTGVLGTVKQAFVFAGSDLLHKDINLVNDFRNTIVAHQDKELTDKTVAGEALRLWINTLMVIQRHLSAPSGGR